MGKKIKICLINPRLEGPYPPLGLGYIASYLRKYAEFNHEFRLVDGNCCKDIFKAITNFNPDVAGFTALSPQIKEAIELSLKLKNFNKDILRVIGGMHVSALPEATLLKGNFDVGVLGEGEQSFLELTDLFMQRGFYGRNLQKIDGIYFYADGNFCRTPARKEIDDLDMIPPPARDLFNMEHYLSYGLLIRGLTGNRVATIMGSRGCPFDCAFCSSKIVFKQPRQFSAKYLIDEIKELAGRYNAKSVFFTDDTFTINRQRIEEFCNLMIKEGLANNIKWDVQGRADLVNLDMLDLLKLMKKAGCVQIDYGFESGSQRMLNFLKKGRVTIEDNTRAIEITKQAGLQVMGTFMIGTSGETDQDLEKTKEFILDNLDKLDHFQTFISTPYPGTELYDVCLNKGLVREDYLGQLEEESKAQGGFSCYCDTIAAVKIKAALKYLNRIAAVKVGLKDKVKWLAGNLIKKPHKIIDAVKSYF